MARTPGTTPVAVPPDFVQGVAATVWNITHSLGRRPSITLYDASGERIEGNVVATDTTATVTFSAAQAGRAVIR